MNDYEEKEITGDDIIEALLDMGFEITRDKGEEKTLSDGEHELTVNRGKITGDTERHMREALRPIFRRYSGTTTLTGNLSRISGWLDRPSRSGKRLI